MDLLDNTIMPYAWGSRTALAELTGRNAPTATAEAELRMGAHPLAPSRLVRGGRAVTLVDAIAEAPERELGAAVAGAFGPRLPFLLKVLAAAEPLSLQAHPTLDQARAGFEDEEKRGIPRDAPHRNYKDPSHKPELLCALTPFDALCGFRRIDDTLALFDALAVPELEAALAPLRASRDGAGLAETFRRLMTTPDGDRARLVEALVDACRTDRGGERFAGERALACRLVELYPGDVGVASALLLNLIRLAPGEAVYLDAGNLHAYLDGTGVEIMASSDNVLRGGLTKKHVDVPELMRTLAFVDGPVRPVVPRPVDAVERVYETPAREFQLSTLSLAPSAPVTRATRGPEILLVTEGAARVDGVRVPRGASVFVPASTASYALQAEGAPATVFRATVGQL